MVRTFRYAEMYETYNEIKQQNQKTQHNCCSKYNKTKQKMLMCHKT